MLLLAVDLKTKTKVLQEKKNEKILNLIGNKNTIKTEISLLPS